MPEGCRFPVSVRSSASASAGEDGREETVEIALPVADLLECETLGLTLAEGKRILKAFQH